MTTDKLREALQMLYDETADYIRLNNLGDVHHNRSMQMARDALQSAAAPVAGVDHQKIMAEFKDWQRRYEIAAESGGSKEAWSLLSEAHAMLAASADAAQGQDKGRKT